jgi:hypothetical protein
MYSYREDYLKFVEYFATKLYDKEAEYSHDHYDRDEVVKEYSHLFSYAVARDIADTYEHMRLEETHHWCERCMEWIPEAVEEHDGNTYCEKCYDRIIRMEDEDDDGCQYDTVRERHELFGGGI